jgi:hypothetical protein
MKTRYLLSLAFVMFTFLAFAQSEENKEEEVVTRPSDIKVADYDEFKNTSFDTYDESLKLKRNMTTLDTDIKGYAGVMKSVLTPKLLADLKAMVAVNDASAALKTKIASLDDKGKELAANAKKAGLKAPSATKNTNSSVSALGKSKNHIESITAMLATDMKLVKDELKARGEPVE